MKNMFKLICGLVLLGLAIMFPSFANGESYINDDIALEMQAILDKQACGNFIVNNAVSFESADDFAKSGLSTVDWQFIDVLPKNIYTSTPITIFSITCIDEYNAIDTFQMLVDKGGYFEYWTAIKY